MKKWILSLLVLCVPIASILAFEGSYCNKIKDSNMKKLCRVYFSSNPTCGLIFNPDWKKYCKANFAYATVNEVLTKPFMEIRNRQNKICGDIKNKNIRVFCLAEVNAVRDRGKDPCSEILDESWKELCSTIVYGKNHPKKGSCRIDNNADLLNLCKALK